MKQPTTTAGRRTLLGAGATLGALAAATSLLPNKAPLVGQDDRAAEPAQAAAEGYRLTEHVKRYYATARL